MVGDDGTLSGGDALPSGSPRATCDVAQLQAAAERPAGLWTCLSLSVSWIFMLVC